MAEFRITWRYIARHLPMIVVECDRCGRSGKYRTDKLVAKYGADSSIPRFQDDIRPHRNGKLAAENLSLR